MLKFRFFCRKHLIVLIGIGIVLVSVLIKALPQGASVVTGGITITTGDNLETITQQNQKGIINWASFDIGAVEKVQFIQPGTSSVTLNRITGGNASSILGQLVANGQIFLINPAGIIFGANSRVDVAGLLATTANISDVDFLAGNYQFMQGPGNASIINQGYIKAANNGFVYIVAPRVENSGLIEANLGKVVLGSPQLNSVYTLDFYGDNLIQFALSPAVGSNIDTAITQSGKIIANGGIVLLTANTVNSVVNNAINMSGIIEANTIANRGGKIILSGGDQGVVSVTGEIIARGNEAGEKGGEVDITGQYVGLFQNAKIDVSGMAGGGEVLIGAEYFDNDVIPAAQSVYVGANTSIFANAITSGDGGKIIMSSNESTRFYGTVEAKGGTEGGDGGLVETSSKNWLDISEAHVDVSAPKGNLGTWLLDPYDVYIVNSTSSSSNGTWDTSNSTWSSGGDDSQVSVADILNNLATANVVIETGGVGSSGSQSGNIFWQADADLTYTGAEHTLSLIAANNIEIAAAITGASLDLMLNAGGTVTFGVGATIAVNSLAVSATKGIDINNGGITTVGTQQYNNAVILGANAVLTTTGSGDIVFVNTIDGAYDLSITAGGSTTFGGEIGTTTPLSSLAVNSTISTNINTANITTIGEQNYTGNVALGNANVTTFTTTNAPVEFAGSITGVNQSVNISSGTGDVGLQAVSNVDTLQLLGSGNKTLGGIISNTASLNIVDGGTTFISAPSITTVGTQAYNNAVVLGESTVLTTTTGDVIFGNTINGAFNLDIVAGGSTTFGGAVGMAPGSVLKSLTVNATSINLNGGAINTTLSQTYNNPVVLGNATILTTTTGDIIFGSTINGVYDLSITAGGSTTFGGEIGTTTPLSSLAVNSTISTNINTANITTVGEQSYTGNVALGNANVTTFTTTNAPVEFAGSITGVNQSVNISSGTGDVGLQAVSNVDTLQLLGSGNKTLGGIISNTASLNIVDGGTTFISAPSITTVGTQAYNNAVVLGESTVLTTTTGDVIFGNTINGAFNLDIVAGGSTTFGGAVGMAPGSVLKSLTVNATSINLNGGAINTTLSQTYNNPVVLGNATILTTTTGDIIFGSTINGVYDLSITAGGSTTFGGEIGTTTPLSSLAVNSTISTNINTANITTVGEQSYTGNVALGNANVTTFTTTNAPVEFAGSITGVNQSVNISSGTGDVGLQAVSNVDTLQLLGSGNKTLGGIISNTASLNIVDGGTTFISAPSITTTGNQTYGNAVRLLANTAIAGNNISFVNTINGAYDLSITAGGSTTFGGEIGTTTPLSSLAVNSTISTNINTANITTIGEQNYTGNVALDNANVTTFTTTNAPVEFAGSITGVSQSVNISSGTGDVGLQAVSNVDTLQLLGSGNKTLGGIISNTASLNIVDGGTTFISAPSITTVGTQAYNNAVVLGESTVLTTTTGDVIFGNTINGAFNLDIVAGGSTTFGGAVGMAPGSVLKSLTVNATSINLNGGAINTTLSQTYNNPVVLGNATILTTTTGDIIFGSTINGVYDLSITAGGSTTFGGEIGTTTPLSSLAVNSTISTNINTANITTVGEQSYTGNVALGNANVTTFTTTNAPVEFAGSITGVNQSVNISSGTGDVGLQAVSNVDTLQLLGSGNKTLGGIISNTASLNIVDGGTTFISAPSITTVGTQAYNNAVVLGESTVLTTTTGDVIFGNTINGAFNLDIVAGGSTTFGGAVGMAPGSVLKSLTVNATSINLNGGAINTTLSQTYNNPVVLGNATILTTTTGDIIFGSTINGVYDLSITAGGSTTFGGEIGTTTPLSSLAVNSTISTNINTANITTVGEQSYTGNVALGNANVTTFTTTNAPVEFAGSITGVNQSVNISSGTGDVGLQAVSNVDTLQLLGSGNKTLGGIISNTASLNIVDGGTTFISAPSITTTGNQTYGNAVRLLANTAIAGNNISFVNTINGGFGLGITAGGSTTFGGEIGTTTPLSSLAVNSTISTNINTANITTIGEQNYIGNVALGNANVTTFTTTNAPVEFAGSITGINQSVNISSGTGDVGLQAVSNVDTLQLLGSGNKTLGGIISNTASLNIVDGGTTFISAPSITTVGTQAYNNAVVLGESTVLTTTTGDVIFGNTINGAFNLDIVAGGSTTFGGAVGMAPGSVLKSLTVNATSINLNGGAINTTLSQTYSNPVVLGNATILTTTTGDIIFGSTINGVYDLSITAGGSTTFGGEIGTTTPLSSLAVNSTISTNINTANITTIGEQNYTGNIALGNANVTTFTTTNAPVEFAGSITGVNQSVNISSGTGDVGLQAVSNVDTLQLLGSGNKTLGGIISNTASLNIVDGGTTFISAPSITTTGNQTYGNAVRLLANTAIAGNNISFVNTINGAYDLSITAGGSTTFGGEIGTTTPLSSLAVNSTISTNINTANITTIGEQNYTGNVALDNANVTTFTTTNAPVEFAGSITGVNQSVNISSGTGDVGLQAVSNVDTLQLLGSGNKTLGGIISNTASLNIAAGGTTFISAPSITTTGNQIYGNAVRLLANTAIAGNNISFVNTINGGFGLGITAGGITTFGGEIGTTTPLSSLAVNSTISTNINTANITTVGEQSYTGNVALGNANVTTFTTTNAPVEFAGSITGVNQSVNISSGAGDVGLQVVSNVDALQLLGSGNKTLGGVISGAASLNIAAGGTTFISAPSITTTGNQTYGNAVRLLANTAIAGNNISFVNTINGGFGLGITAGGSTTFGGEIGTTTPLSSLAVNSTISTNINTANITTIGEQNYIGNVALGNANVTTFTTTNAPVEFAGSITGINQSVNISSGTGDVGLQAVSNVGALQLLGSGNKTLGGIISNTASLNVAVGGTTFINASSITTTGNQTYGNAVNLLAYTALTGNNINFVDKINGGFGLGITAAGSATFGGAVGITNALSYLTVTADSINISGGAIKTNVSQTYNNPVILGANTVLTTTDAAGNIVFVSTVDSDGVSRTLELNAQGNIILNAAVGGISPLSGLLIDTSAGTTYLNGDAVTTSGNQTYGENVILGDNTTFNASNIIFAKTLNSDTTSRLPTFNILGNTTFGGAVGGVNALFGLTTGTTGTIYINGGWVNTIGFQYYQEPVILGANTLLTGSAIGFTSTIDSSNSISPSSLTLSTPGGVVFAGMIGGNNPLHNLTVGGGGILYFFGNGATTTGFQTYNDAIDLRQNVFLTAGNGITFNSTITGPHNLFLDTGNSGNILFNGAVGAYADSIGLLYIKNAHNVTANAGVYVTAFEQNAGSGVTLFNNTLYVGLGSTSGFVHGTGPAIIITNGAVGNIDVGTLYLGTSSALLTGYVGGVLGVPAAKSISLLNKIAPGTSYYDMIDLYGLVPASILNDSLMQSILESLYSGLNFGFGYEFLDMGNSKFDYLFLLEPPQCG